VIRRSAVVQLMLLTCAASAGAQSLSYRGFAELRATGYPQTTPRDDDQIVADGHVRFDLAYRAADWLAFSSSIDGRTDNVEQVERKWRVDLQDRGIQRPAFSLRQAEVTFHSRHLVADAGKQFIRWGKTDILTPTDRFAPRDFLEVTDADYLAVTGGRVQYLHGPSTLDLVAVPIFTPSRIPLLGRRWAAVPPQFEVFRLVDVGPRFPTRTQFGARWGIVRPQYDFSVSYFDGFNHLPEIAAVPLSSTQAIAVSRAYPALKMIGADAAVPFRWFTVKAEAASLRTTSPLADDAVQYVIQLERQTGELSLVGGYAGEVVVTRRSVFDFAPDRGLTRAFLGRATYTLGPTRSVAFEAAVRQNVDGVWIKGEYSQANGAHWRTTFTGTVIGGSADDFFGQYRRNSHVIAALRYSF
jgi:hypothetical protein